MNIVWAWPGEPLNAALKRWAADHIWPGASANFGDAAVMGVFDDTGPIAAMVWHDYDPATGVIEFSGAATTRRWLTRRSLGTMFAYPFEGLGCQMVVCRTSAGEEQGHLHRMLTAYGFDHVHIPRLGGRDRDLLVFTLTDDAWKANRFNQTISSAA